MKLYNKITMVINKLNLNFVFSSMILSFSSIKDFNKIENNMENILQIHIFGSCWSQSSQKAW